MIHKRKFSISRMIATSVFIFLSILLAAQNQFTAYDDIPGNIKSYKPAYKAEYPEWAQMLYTDTINYLDISIAYQQWESKDTKDHRAIRRYYKIWSKNILPWVVNNYGDIELPDMNVYHKLLRATQTEVSATTQVRGDEDWTFLGPKETFWLNESNPNVAPGKAAYQANVYSFDVATNNTDILYCGTETGFINKSTDKGASWSQMGLDYNFGGGITEVAIDHTDENIVFVSGGKQVHKTTDGGLTWSPLLSGSDRFGADKMEIDRSNNNNNNNIYAASSDGLFVSTDAGMVWTKAHNARVYDVHQHPTDVNIVYGLSNANGNFRLVVSTDGGQTFSNEASFPQDIVDVSGGLLAVTNASPNSIFCVMLSANETPLLYKGNIETAEWNLITSGKSSALAMDNWQGYYDLVLEVSNEDANLIYTGTASLFKSSDGGNTFSNMGGYNGRHALHPDIQDMKVLSNGEVWVATDGGINYTNDDFGNHHEVKNNLLIGSEMWGFDQSWNEDLIVGGRYHNGNTAISDYYGDKALRMGGAESPTGWVKQGRERHVAFNDLGAGWILPKTAEGLPEGRFLFSQYPNMDEYGGRRSNMLFHTNYFGHILLGEGNGLWRSTDSGMSYNMIYDFGGRVRWMQAAYLEPDVIYADVVNQGLLRSEDGGLTWQAKPSLTSAPNGNNNWAGRLFIAISPTDANTIYACLQNGTWSSDIGKIFKSTDGGDSWENWTNGLSEYTKSFVVQPDDNGQDIVYLFTNARDRKSKVYVRHVDSQEWEDCSTGFPSGFHVNLALPFYRDSKLRVSGNGGIWESPLVMSDYTPIINPWVEKANYNCITDSVYFEDHSIIDHEDAQWRWEITPTPEYISDENIRNPVVVLGNEGSYDVTMYITKEGQEYSKTINDMIRVSPCPSINDCTNPDNIPKEDWELVFVDSEEPNDPGLAIMAFDDDPNTIWHTRWTSGNDTYPHEMIVDMSTDYLASSFTYLPRQNGVNGRIKEYELYLSLDGDDWSDPIAFGEFANTSAPTKLNFTVPTICRYFKLVCLSEQNGNIWSSAAELSMTGCLADQVSIQEEKLAYLNAFPVPSIGVIHIDVPSAKEYQYTIVDATGRAIRKGLISSDNSGSISFDLSAESVGIYILTLSNKAGVTYTAKVVKL